MLIQREFFRPISTVECIVSILKALFNFYKIWSCEFRNVIDCMVSDQSPHMFLCQPFDL